MRQQARRAHRERQRESETHRVNEREREGWIERYKEEVQGAKHGVCARACVAAAQNLNQPASAP
jgi:hypothetical protein